MQAHSRGGKPFRFTVTKVLPPHPQDTHFSFMHESGSVVLYQRYMDIETQGLTIISM